MGCSEGWSELLRLTECGSEQQGTGYFCLLDFLALCFPPASGHSSPAPSLVMWSSQQEETRSPLVGVKVPQFIAWVLRRASGLRYKEHYDGQCVLRAPFFTLSSYHGTLQSSSHRKEERVWFSTPDSGLSFMICFGQGDVSRCDTGRGMKRSFNFSCTSGTAIGRWPAQPKRGWEAHWAESSFMEISWQQAKPCYLRVIPISSYLAGYPS